MAEVRVVDLPSISLEQFTGNDSFIIVDDGNTRRLTRDVLETWLVGNIQGERGEQGVAGRDGVRGVNGTNGTNGTNGLSAYQLAVSNGFVGTLTDWLLSLKGANGAAGVNGGNGWSPVFQVETLSTGSYLKVIDWVGGTGVKPTTVGYLGSTGIVTEVTYASNIKGSVGDRGVQGAIGIQGVKGDKGDTGNQGDMGYSPYDLAVDSGFIGTKDEWLLSLNASTISSEPNNTITKKIDGLYVPAPDTQTLATAIEALPDTNFLSDEQKSKLESLKILTTEKRISIFDDKVKYYGESGIVGLSDLTFTKVSTGEYTIGDTTGYTVGNVTLPTDLDGNILLSCTITESTGVITIKTFNRTFDAITGLFTANIGEPTDIPSGKSLGIQLNN